MATPSSSVTLENVSFRVVGPFLRVNQPYTAVETPPRFGSPFNFDFPTLTVDQPSSVGAVMRAVQAALPALGFTFGFSNLSGAGRGGLLDVVEFGPIGGPLLRLDATAISNALAPLGTPDAQLVAAWQYYVFRKGRFSDDERVEVSGRSPYDKSVVIRSDMRIIWRLLVVYRGSTSAMAMV